MSLAVESQEAIDMLEDDSSSTYAWHHLQLSSLFHSMRHLAGLSDCMYIYLLSCFPRPGFLILLL